ncbi:MAG: hypothetical protein AAB789_01195 [Patescibacteria group bacterium]
MEENNLEKYLPLKAVAELYGYTRDHLGLMIRQNKLKGIKIGSYYVTTNEWMTGYIKNFADPGHPISRSKLSNKFLTEILSSKKSGLPAKAVAPENAGLKRKILEELTQYKLLADDKALKADINQQEKIVSTFSNAPYVILPIRKMEYAEREEVLKKVG